MRSYQDLDRRSHRAPDRVAEEDLSFGKIAVRLSEETGVTITRDAMLGRARRLYFANRLAKPDKRVVAKPVVKPAGKPAPFSRALPASPRGFSVELGGFRISIALNTSAVGPKRPPDPQNRTGPQRKPACRAVIELKEDLGWPAKFPLWRGFRGRAIRKRNQRREVKLPSYSASADPFNQTRLT
jgi:hypothetical protein